MAIMLTPLFVVQEKHCWAVFTYPLKQAVHPPMKYEVAVEQLVSLCNVQVVPFIQYPGLQPPHVAAAVGQLLQYPVEH